MSTAKKKTIKFTALMTVLIMTVSYFSLLTPTSAYFYKEIDKEGTITFSLLEVNDGEKIFDEEATLKFKGATKFADYGEKLFDEVAEVKEFTVTNTGVDAKILPRITLHGDSAKNGLKYIVITEKQEIEAVSEEVSDNDGMLEQETLAKGKLKEEIESRLELFTEATSVEYSNAVSALDKYNEIKSIELKNGESVNVKIIFWAEYDEVMAAAGGESVWQDAESVTTVPYQCTIEIIASQLSDNDEAVTKALAEVPTWKTTEADNQ